MACTVDNNAFEITPSRKRKRDCDCKSKISEGLSNKGFTSTSTPKKESKHFLGTLTRFSENKKINYTDKENNFAGMEIKSISELATITSANKEFENLSENPYEVVRKPPKKKKKDFCDEEANCFVNPALNLEIPDKKFNPFEVKRISLPKDPKESNSNCFVNPGLNIRAEDNIVNPYEITRTKVIENQENGIENQAMDLPCMWTLGIPFTPNIGCRIDFNNIPLEELTPSKLLAEKLTFSPINARVAALKSQTKDTFQRSLSIITEETVDIGKELDCYQLELENSINEAKLKIKTQDIISSDEKTKHIAEISGIDILVEDNDPKTPTIEVTKNESTEIKNEKFIEELKENTSEEQNEMNKSDRNYDTLSEKCIDDSFNDDLDFKAPTPFVRAYRKPTVPIQTKEEAPKLLETKTKSKSNPVASVIRKSIRKLIHAHGKSEKPPNKKNEENDKSQNSQTESAHTNHIFESIRYSLRRKPNKNITKSTEKIEENENENIVLNSKDITLSERQIFRSATEEFIVEKKISLRNSIRRSTKGVKNHVMKTVFKKNVEEYEFTK